jgi:hypothetical protein
MICELLSNFLFANYEYKTAILLESAWSIPPRRNNFYQMCNIYRCNQKQTETQTMPSAFLPEVCRNWPWSLFRVSTVGIRPSIVNVEVWPLQLESLFDVLYYDSVPCTVMFLGSRKKNPKLFFSWEVCKNHVQQNSFREIYAWLHNR